MSVLASVPLVLHTARPRVPRCGGSSYRAGCESEASTLESQAVQQQLAFVILHTVLFPCGVSLIRVKYKFGSVYALRH